MENKEWQTKTENLQAAFLFDRGEISKLPLSW